MKAELLIHYTAHSVVHGNRRFAETVTLEFQEPSDDEAPIAVEWEYGATRWFEGEHYRRMETPGGTLQILHDRRRDLAFQHPSLRGYDFAVLRPQVFGA